MTEQTQPAASPGDVEASSQDAQATSHPSISEKVRALKLGESELPTSQSGGLRRWRRWVLLLIVILLAVLWKVGLLQSIFAPGAVADANALETYVASYEPAVDVVLDVSGYVVAHATVKVSPVIPGTIKELAFDEGDRVQQGDVLARLDDTQYRADLDQADAVLAAAEAHLAELRKGTREEDLGKAQAAVEQAEARLDLLSRDAERAKTLQDTISQSEYDRAIAAHQEAIASVQQLKLALKLLELGPRSERITAAMAEVNKARALRDKAQYFVDCTKIISPVTGTIIERKAELGERTRPEAVMESLFVIADLSQLEAEIDIPEYEVSALQLGQPCTITTEAFPDHEYEGRLHWFSPEFNRQRGVRRAKALVTSPDEHLLPNMTCRVRILSDRSDQQNAKRIRVPQRAIVQQDEKTLVYVFRDQVVHHRAVQVGKTRDQMVEIQEGLQDGEVLLISPNPLEDGQKVHAQVQPEKTAT